MINADPRSCRYCSKQSLGPGCAFSPLPTKSHVAIGDNTFCIFCGKNSFGSGCQFSNLPGKKHKHGHGANKCIFCGSTSLGLNGCPHSPTKAHER